jgi:hypothetical protein
MSGWTATECARGPTPWKRRRAGIVGDSDLIDEVITWPGAADDCLDFVGFVYIADGAVSALRESEHRPTLR